MSRLLLSNAILVLGLFSVKEYLLSRDVGVFWVLIRVLAVGGIGLVGWEAMRGGWVKLTKSSIEVCMPKVGSIYFYLCLFFNRIATCSRSGIFLAIRAASRVNDCFVSIVCVQVGLIPSTHSDSLTFYLGS